MVGGRCCSFNSKQSVQLLHEGSNKLWSVIRYDLPREAVELPDVSEVEVGCSSSCNSGQHLGEVGSLAYEVNRHHDGIVSTRFRELGDEVYADGIPAFLGNWERLKF